MKDGTNYEWRDDELWVCKTDPQKPLGCTFVEYIPASQYNLKDHIKRLEACSDILRASYGRHLPFPNSLLEIIEIVEALKKLKISK